MSLVFLPPVSFSLDEVEYYCCCSYLCALSDLCWIEAYIIPSMLNLFISFLFWIDRKTSLLFLERACETQFIPYWSYKKKKKRKKRKQGLNIIGISLVEESSWSLVLTLTIRLLFYCPLLTRDYVMDPGSTYTWNCSFLCAEACTVCLWILSGSSF